MRKGERLEECGRCAPLFFAKLLCCPAVYDYGSDCRRFSCRNWNVACAVESVKNYADCYGFAFFGYYCRVCAVTFLCVAYLTVGVIGYVAFVSVFEPHYLAGHVACSVVSVRNFNVCYFNFSVCCNREVDVNFVASFDWFAVTAKTERAFCNVRCDFA